LYITQRHRECSLSEMALVGQLHKIPPHTKLGFPTKLLQSEIFYVSLRFVPWFYRNCLHVWNTVKNYKQKIIFFFFQPSISKEHSITWLQCRKNRILRALPLILYVHIPRVRSTLPLPQPVNITTSVASVNTVHVDRG